MKESWLSYEKGMHFNLENHKTIFALTVLDLGGKCVIAKVQYLDGMVGERKFETNEFTDLIVEY